MISENIDKILLVFLIIIWAIMLILMPVYIYKTKQLIIEIRKLIKENEKLKKYIVASREAQNHPD